MSELRMQEEVIEKLKDQKVLEDEMARSLSTFYDSTKNPLVRLFIHWIILDTIKHSDIYQTLITMNSGIIVGEIEKERITKELQTHISAESEMLERGREIGEQIRDKHVRKLFDTVIDDERRHHQILVDLLWTIEKVDELSREDWYQHLYTIAKHEKRIPRIGRESYIRRQRAAR